MTSPSRRLTSDALGKKGERRFGELCDDADLVANVSDHDRAGWDYIVDFRYPAIANGLDARPAPPSARIQVKTQWADRDTVKVRLSAAEQLAKHTGPSFFCVLSVDDALAFTGMRLLHCRGELLERILRRLREAEARGEAPNAVWLTLRPSDFAPALPPTGAALKAAIEAACGPAALAYLSAKDRELRTLGFDKGGLRVNLELSGDEDALLDAFLGLRPLDANTLSVTSTRFGVELPVRDRPTGPGVVRFEPKGDRCRLVFSTPDRRYEFAARSYRVPQMVAASSRKSKVRIVAETFSVILTMTKRSEDNLTVHYSFTMAGATEEPARKPKDWAALYGMWAALTDHGAEMAIFDGKTNVFHQFVRIPHPDTARWRAIARVTEAAALVFEDGGAPNVKTPLQAIWDAHDELVTLAAMSREPETISGLSFTTIASIPLPRDGPVRMMLGHAFRVGDHILCFTAGVEVTGQEEEDGDWRWTSDTTDLMKIRRVRSEAEFFALMDRSPSRPYRVVTGVWQAARPIISRLEPRDRSSPRDRPVPDPRGRRRRRQGTGAP